MHPERRRAIYSLGIDVGTTGTRALLLSERGLIVASSTAPHAPIVSPHVGWAEQDPTDWWQACVIAIRNLLAESKISGDQIACVALAGQMHGAVLLDEGANVVRPALIWCDVRNAKQSADLAQKIGEDKIIQLTCNPPLVNFTLPKLLWVRESEPENWKRVHSVLLPKDYVRFRLTGERAIDVAEASGTLLLDVAKRRWSKQMLDLTEIDEIILPGLHESTDICGRISATGAAETGLLPGTPVAAGAGDQQAGAVGMGITTPGAASVTIGSSGVVFAVTEGPKLDIKGRLHTFCHAIPNCWHVMGVTQSAGLSLRWFRDTFATNGNRETYERLDQEAGSVPPGSDGLLWTPYLMGERTPHLDPEARAALIGITAVHRRGHVIRAIMEGVAFSLKDCMAVVSELDIPIATIRIGGGGAKSPLWQQIQADVFGHEVEILQTEEGPALGAAILAGVAIRMWPTVKCAADAVVRVSHHVSPNLSASINLARSYASYQKIYKATKSISMLDH